MDLPTAIKYLIWVQQLILLAPYRIKNGRAVSSRFLSLYSYFAIAFYLVVLIAAVDFMRRGDFVKLQFSNGYLWGIIGVFELTFTNLSYPFLVFLLLLFRNRTIKFINSLVDIDDALQREFNADITALNIEQRKRTYVFIVSTLLYFYSLWFLVFFFVLPWSYITNKAILFLIVANQLEQYAMSLLTWNIMLYCILIMRRFEMLMGVDLKGILALSDEQCRRRLMAIWLTTFRDLCRAIEQINDNLGLVIAWRYSHDFTLLISQLYLVYWIVDSGGSFTLILTVFYWLMQNVIKLFGIGYSAHMATRKVFLITKR